MSGWRAPKEVTIMVPVKGTTQTGTGYMNFRIDAKEHNVIKDAAKALGLTPSEWVRTVSSQASHAVAKEYRTWKRSKKGATE